VTSGKWQVASGKWQVASGTWSIMSALSVAVISSRWDANLSLLSLFSLLARACLASLRQRETVA